MTLYVAGEHIKAGRSVVVADDDGKVYCAGSTAGVMIGDAMEELREGFGVQVAFGEVREDDA